MSLMTIGEVANAVGVSPKAVRLWEAKGLIPEMTRTEAGYRVFRDTDLSMLRFISQAKRLGLTLSEIKEIINARIEGGTPCGRVTQMIDEHLARIDQALEELHHIRDTLTAARSHTESSVFNADNTMICQMIERIHT